VGEKSVKRLRCVRESAAGEGVSLLQQEVSGKLTAALLLAGGIGAGVLSIFPGQERMIIAFLLLLALGSLVVRNPLRAAFMLLIFLSTLGFFRRLLISVSGIAAYDPLVLIPPAVVGLLFMVSVWKAEDVFNSLLARLVGMLMIVIIYQVFNPLQGGLPVGLAGTIFFLTPLCWFYIGRRYLGTEAFTVLERILIGMGLVCGVYGLWQNMVGFFPFEEAWVEAVRHKYVTLVVYGKTRAFSTFASFTEFTNFMSVILVLSCSKLLFRAGSWPLFLLLGAVAMACIVYSGMRGTVVMFILSAMAVAAVRHYRRPLRIILSITVILLLLSVFLALIGNLEFSPESAPVAEHLVGGLTDPLNPQKSSLVHHVDSMLRGMRIGTANPLGFGTGSTNLGGDKFRGINLSAEVDLVDTLMATGWAGGIIYLAVVGLVIWQAVRLNAMFPHNYQFCMVLWILLFLGGQWLNGGNYFLSSLVWLLAGWLDGKHDEIARGKRTGPGSEGT